MHILLWHNCAGLQYKAHGSFVCFQVLAGKLVNDNTLMDIVTPTDSSKSVCNCYVIELFGGVLVLLIWLLWSFCWGMSFCHKTESGLSSFLFFSKSEKISLSAMKCAAG